MSNNLQDLDNSGVNRAFSPERLNAGPEMLAEGMVDDSLLPALHVYSPANNPNNVDFGNVVIVHDDSREQSNGKQTNNSLGDYLEDRRRGTANNDQSIFIGGRTPRPSTAVQKNRWVWDRWLWTGGSAKNHITTMAAVTVAANLLVNTAINLDDVGTGLQDGADLVAEGAHKVNEAIEDQWSEWFDDEVLSRGEMILPQDPIIKTETIVTKGQECTDETTPDENDSLELAVQFEAGESTPQSEVIAEWTSKIGELVENGYTIKGINVAGSSSDDWFGRDDSLMVPEQQNATLSLERAEEVARLLQESLDFSGIVTPNVTSEANQDILEIDEFTNLKIMAESFGYDDISSAIKIYNNPDTRDSLPDSLRAGIQISIGDLRGALVLVGAEKNGRTVTTCIPVVFEEDIVTEIPQPDIVIPPFTPEEPVEEPYENKDRDYDPNLFLFPVVWPPLPKWRREPYMKEKPGKPGKAAREVGDNIFVKLYPEAVRFDSEQQKDGDLAPDAWAWTRKYQALIRDDRIKSILTHNYIDDGNNDRSMQMMFVDHEPTEEMVEAMSSLLEKMSLLNDGRIPRSMNTIAVFPRNHAGPQYDARHIGMGIDEQYGKNVLGVAIPALSLVELHAPTNPSKSELEQIEHGVNWVTAHEVAGHFTDVKDLDVKISQDRSTRARLFGGRRFTSSNPWQERGKRMYKQIIRQYGRKVGTSYDVEHSYQSNLGDVVDNTETVRTLPSSLFAKRVRQNGMPTDYGATDQAEMYAEVAGSLVTGLGLKLPGGTMTNPGFAQNAMVDKDLQSMYEQVNAVSISDSGIVAGRTARSTESETYFHRTAASNSRYARLRRRAISTPFPGESNLISITAKVRGNQ